MCGSLPLTVTLSVAPTGCRNPAVGAVTVNLAGTLDIAGQNVTLPLANPLVLSSGTIADSAGTGTLTLAADPTLTGLTGSIRAGNLTWNGTRVLNVAAAADRARSRPRGTLTTVARLPMADGERATDGVSDDRASAGPGDVAAADAAEHDLPTVAPRVLPVARLATPVPAIAATRVAEATAPAPIVAHATTNLILGIWVLRTGAWSFW